jgi:hypothetical protein
VTDSLRRGYHVRWVVLEILYSTIYTIWDSELYQRSWHSAFEHSRTTLLTDCLLGPFDTSKISFVVVLSDTDSPDD